MKSLNIEGLGVFKKVRLPARSRFGRGRSSKAAALFTRGAYFQYVSTGKWRPACAKPLRQAWNYELVSRSLGEGWQLFSTAPYETGVSWGVESSDLVAGGSAAAVGGDAAGFSEAAASALGFGAGFAAGGFGGGLGFSGLIPPSQWGPVYMSSASPASFHFFSKSAAALLGVSPMPTVRFQG